MSDELQRFDLWLATKYFEHDKDFIDKLYNSKDFSHGYSLAVTLVSSWLIHFYNNPEQLEAIEILEEKWNKIYNSLGENK